MTSGETRTVYLLGACINKGVMSSFYSRARGNYTLEPPLVTNFFQQALQLPPALDHPSAHREQFAALYDYIERYWKLSVEDLRTDDFDLEACFTLIQQQEEAERSGNREGYRRLLVIGNQLRLLLAHLLSEYLRLSPIRLSAEEAEALVQNSTSGSRQGKAGAPKEAVGLSFPFPVGSLEYLVARFADGAFDLLLLGFAPSKETRNTPPSVLTSTSDTLFSRPTGPRRPRGSERPPRRAWSPTASRPARRAYVPSKSSKPCYLRTTEPSRVAFERLAAAISSRGITGDPAETISYESRPKDPP